MLAKEAEFRLQRDLRRYSRRTGFYRSDPNSVPPFVIGSGFPILAGKYFVETSCFRSVEEYLMLSDLDFP